MLIFIQIFFNITTDLNTKIRHALVTLADDIKLRGITRPEKVYNVMRKNEINLGIGLIQVYLT